MNSIQAKKGFGERFKAILSKPILWLIIIFAIVLALRIYIAFETPLLNYDAYFGLRQVENIKDTGLPLYNDPLSYSGKVQLFAPLNHYLLSIFSFFMPIESAGKIVPNIIAATIIFIVYYLSLKITKSPKISLWTAFMSGVIPIYFIDLNRASSNYLTILLVLTIIYCMLKLNERKYVDYALILMFLLVLTTPAAFVLMLGLLIYLLLLKLENFAVEMKELEIILFFTFLVFWVNLLIYKNAFLTHGLGVIWQNIPISILSNFFGKIGFIQVLGAISIIPLILGVYSFYAAFHLDRNKDVMLLVAIGISTFILLWFKLLNLVGGLIFLSMILTILAAYSLKRIEEFIEKSRIRKYYKLIQVTFTIIFLITVVPSIFSIVRVSDIGPLSTPNIEDVKALLWASENTPKNAVIMSGLDEGNIVTYYAHRKNVMDTNFLLTPRIDQRKNDVDEVYTTNFETRAIEILNKYNAKYLLITSKNLEQYDIESPSYLKDSKCFTLEYYSKDTYLYRTDCKIV
ncbi:MAG: hypothetical protein ACP5OA_07155 [Candidatus Woesearchaeota archaeon]